MTTATKHAAKTTPKKVREKPLTVEEKLDGLIAWLKDHGLHYDGSPAPEPEEDKEAEA